MNNIKIVNLAGIGISVALASGCITRGSASFPGESAEPDLSMPGGENPMPMAVSPVQPGNVVYPAPQPEKKPEYWQQVNDPYAELSKGRPYVGQGFVIAPPANARAAAGSSVYVVKKGDSLGAIAQNHKVTLKALKAANPGIDYDKIKVGQKINIPAASATATKASAASSAPQAGIHVVKSGEILSRIARQYGVKVADLKAANGLTSDKIVVGQKLKIPGKAAAAPAKTAEPAKTTATGSIEVAPPKSDLLPPPDVAEQPIEIAPPAIEPSAPQPIAAEAAQAATTVYLASGSEDLYNIAVDKTIGIAEIERLNPELAGNRSRILPAGTPVVLPAR